MRVKRIAATLLGSALTVACGAGSPASDAPVSSQPAAEVASAQPAPPPTPDAAPVLDAPKVAIKPARKPAPAAPPAKASHVSPAAVAPVAYRTITVPAGTALPLELMTALSSETDLVEAPVKARLQQAVAVDGMAILPAGTELHGTVSEVANAGRVKGRAKISFAFTEAMVSGARETLRTNPLTFEAEATKGADAAKIGIGAGVGAVLGGVLGGGSGAAKGAAIGGAAGTGAVLATKGREVTVAAGTQLTATLADAYETRVRVQ